MKKHILLITISMLILPLFLIAIAWVVFNKFIFDNPNFWYGYMAYFGTIVLASVSLWQNENAKETNERMTQQQLRQKIGYFSLKENEGEMRKINKFSDIQVGQIYSLDGKLDESKEKTLNVFLKNIGEDLIILKSLNASINNICTSVPCDINNILKNETIAFFIDVSSSYQSEALEIDLIFRLQNIAGVDYTQEMSISCYNTKATAHGTYRIEKFKSSFSFNKG